MQWSARFIGEARRVGALILTIAPGLVLATPALAMTPSFKLDVTQVGGSSLAITVTFEQMPQGFNWASLEASGVLDELVGTVSADEVDARGRPIDTSLVRLVSLRRVGVGVYEAVVAVESGRTAVIPWPLVSQFNEPGALSTRYVTVGSTLPRLVLAVALIGVASLLVWWRWRSSRSRASIDGQTAIDVRLRG